jgi:hypothetical protein
VCSSDLPDMMDDDLKVQKINETYREIKEGYVLNVDFDEFVSMRSLTAFSDVMNIQLLNVYRHKDDKDLDINIPVLKQRTHGTFDSRYNKPILLKAGLDAEWLPGNHALKNGHHFGIGLWGAHWANADPCFCVERRVKNRSARQSKNNYDKGYTVQHWHLTPEMVLKECKAHEDDPQLW